MGKDWVGFIDQRVHEFQVDQSAATAEPSPKAQRNSIVIINHPQYVDLVQMSLNLLLQKRTFNGLSVFYAQRETYLN